MADERIYQRGDNKRFRGIVSRTKQRIANNLGIIDAGTMNVLQKFRDPKLELYDSYYEARQYDKLQDWDEAIATKGDYVAVRKRKPRINYNLAKVLVDKVAANLVGQNVFPRFNIADDPDTTEYMRVIQKVSGFKYKLLEPVRFMLLSSSSLVRYYLSDGTIKIEGYKSKYCYPTFLPNGELQLVSIKYVFEDHNDRDSGGKPKQKWYKLDLGMQSDILYNNPPFESNVEPQFEVVEQTDHGLGFVQAEWLRTGEDIHSPDSYSIIEDILELIDEINYSLSQSSQAVSYNQEPQLTLNGMDEDEVDDLIRSSEKAWNLGREGKAQYLETSLGGVEAANMLRDRVRKKIVDVVRVVMLDPEKIVGSAQSAKAMEVLHGPLVELISELRPQLEHRLSNLLIKMAMTVLDADIKGMETVVAIPPGYVPTSFDIAVTWPPLFPLTIEDLQKKVSISVQAGNASIFSRETMMRWLAPDFGIEDIDEELAKIAAQPVLNPFGAF